LAPNQIGGVPLLPRAQAFIEQQKRSRVLVLTEILTFSVVVAALATTAILTRSRNAPPPPIVLG
jgi:hypothetical protein